MVILATVLQTVYPQSQVKYTFLPMMKRYGILLGDRKLHQSLLCDLIALNQKHKMGQQNNMMLYGVVRKGHFNMVLIPGAESLGQIRRKEKIFKMD